MTGKTHAICGTVTMAAITAVYLSGFEFDGYTYLPAVGLLTAAAGSYAPDIDIPRSRLGQKHKFISKHLTHRGITHTLVMPLLLFILMMSTAAANIQLLPELLLGFIIGWVVHIAADLCNRKGVPLLWPVYRKRIHIATFLTGTWHEGVFILLWAGVNIAWVYFQFT